MGVEGVKPPAAVTANNANPREWGTVLAAKVRRTSEVRRTSDTCPWRLWEAALRTVTANNANPREWGTFGIYLYSCEFVLFVDTDL